MSLNCVDVNLYLVVEGHPRHGNQHSTCVSHSDRVPEQKQGHRDDDDPLGDVGNRVADWSYSRDHAEGKYVLAETEEAIEGNVEKKPGNMGSL